MEINETTVNEATVIETTEANAEILSVEEVAVSDIQEAAKKPFNPTKKLEVFLLIGNFICYLVILTLLTGLSLFGMYGYWHIVRRCTIIIAVLIFVLFALNIAIGIRMRKIGKETPIIGKYKEISRMSYILYYIILGNLGMHKFQIDDRKGGLIRLVVCGSAMILTAVLNQIETVGIALFAIYYILTSLRGALLMTDFVVALARVKNENNNIVIG